jgi:formyltetrahydrofolate deformylase
MDLIITLSCVDQPGIVHAMTTSVLSCGGNITENQQFTDPITHTFVMRTRFETDQSLSNVESSITSGLSHLKPKITIRPVDQKKRALILVTTESHCLRDLLYLKELDELPIQIPAVISNHQTLRTLVESHGIPFHHIDTEKLGKEKAEAQTKQIADENKIDFLLLARYMQILSPAFCQAFDGRVINIHHSFLPGFKGAKPYHQAHERGVKVIGATAHFVTSNLDEGPIIDQDVAHVNHSSSPDDLIAIGRDIERRVLSKAAKLYAEDKIFIVGNRTVVF